MSQHEKLESGQEFKSHLSRCVCLLIGLLIGAELTLLQVHHVSVSSATQTGSSFFREQFDRRVPSGGASPPNRSAERAEGSHTVSRHTAVCVYLNEIYNDMQSVRRSSVMS